MGEANILYVESKTALIVTKFDLVLNLSAFMCYLPNVHVLYHFFGTLSLVLSRQTYFSEIFATV